MIEQIRHVELSQSPMLPAALNLDKPCKEKQNIFLLLEKEK